MLPIPKTAQNGAMFFQKIAEKKGHPGFFYIMPCKKAGQEEEQLHNVSKKELPEEVIHTVWKFNLHVLLIVVKHNNDCSQYLQNIQRINSLPFLHSHSSISIEI